MATDISALDPPALRDLAISLARKDERDRHWSRLALILHRVEAMRLYATPDFGARPSLRAWALDDLGLGSDDVGLLRRLAAMMLDHQDTIPVETWREVGKGKAQILLRVHKLGADGPAMRTWLDRATTMTTTELDEAYSEAVGEDVWVEWSVSVPKDVARMLDAALACFVPEVVGPDCSEKSVHDREVRHLLAEQMAQETIARFGRPEGQGGAPWASGWAGRVRIATPPAKGRPAVDSDAYLRICEWVLERDGWRCVHCLSPRDLQVDHRTPRSLGGADTPDNLWTLCARDHALKEQGILVPVQDQSTGRWALIDRRRAVRCVDCHRTLDVGETAVLPTLDGGANHVVIGRGA